MGEIIYWTILRTAITIALVWVLKAQIDEQLWYIITFALVYGFVIHPAVLSYRKFEKRNRILNNSTICANCKHYDSSAVLCLKHDKHPSENYVPCDGVHWEPR